MKEIAAEIESTIPRSDLNRTLKAQTSQGVTTVPVSHLIGGGTSAEARSDESNHGGDRPSKHKLGTCAGHRVIVCLDQKNALRRSKQKEGSQIGRIDTLTQSYQGSARSRSSCCVSKSAYVDWLSSQTRTFCFEPQQQTSEATGSLEVKLRLLTSRQRKVCKPHRRLNQDRTKKSEHLAEIPTTQPPLPQARLQHHRKLHQHHPRSNRSLSVSLQLIGRTFKRSG